MTPLWPRRRNDDRMPAATAAADSAPASGPGFDGPGQVVVGDGGVGAGGDVSHNAFGDHSQVIDNRRYFLPAPAKDVSWPVEVGAIPALATAFQPRTGLCDQIDTVRMAGDAAVLTQVLAGGGGVGKSQLAAKYAAEALGDGTDLVVWAAAAETEQVVTRYAQAALLVAVPGATGEDPEDDARAFLSWLATTERRWLVILDDITDPAAMAPWWPASRTGSGWVLASTRLHDAALTGNGRRRVLVDVYTPGEAAAYLRGRLTDDGAEHLLSDSVEDLAAALGHLPLALGHAAAYMLNQDITVTEYLALFNDHDRRLDQLLPEGADAEGYGRQVAATLLLSLDAAQRAEPAGLARPALRLAALLGPAGHPHDLWTTPTVLAYLDEQREHAPGQGSMAAGKAQGPVSAEQARAVLRVLHRYALISCDRSQGHHAVRVHALTARAVRENTPEETLPRLAHTAADALCGIWPNPDQPHPDLAATLRANTDHLYKHTGNRLWQPEGHLVLRLAGESLANAGHGPSAIAYWEQLTEACRRVHGDEHRETLLAWGNLGTAFYEAGRSNEAIPLLESVLAARQRVLGPWHPDVHNAMANLAAAYMKEGRTDEAIPHQEAVLTVRERALGSDHPLTLLIRANLAVSYLAAGRTDKSIPMQEAVLLDRERIFGPDHPETLTARNNLAGSYERVARLDEAITLQEAVLAGRIRVLGPQHPHTISARGSLARFCWRGGLLERAIDLQQSAFTDHQLTLGAENPVTIAAQANLAALYSAANRTEEAISTANTALANYENILGPLHPDTVTVRRNLDSFRRMKRDR